MVDTLGQGLLQDAHQTGSHGQGYKDRPITPLPHREIVMLSPMWAAVVVTLKDSSNQCHKWNCIHKEKQTNGFVGICLSPDSRSMH
jgi:hypothetical protein